MRRAYVFLTGLGNVFEWFDFGLLVFLSGVIGNQFFPFDTPINNVLAAFAVFATGFLARPLGALMFGRWGDTRGRAITLRYSLMLISAATFAIGLIPSYHQIGISAAILFTLLRIIQGISVGGEYAGVMIYLAETATAARRGVLTSLAPIGANIGFLLAIIAVAILKNTLSADSLAQWGWRVPFIVIGLAGLVLFYYRLRLAETVVYHQLQIAHHVLKHPLRTASRFAYKNIFQALGLASIGAIFYYLQFAYITAYLIQPLHLDENIVFLMQIISLLLMLILVPCAALCGDRLGRKRVLKFTVGGIILFTIPYLFVLQLNNLWLTGLFFLCATVLSSFEQGNTLVTLVENSPVDVRYSVVAFSFNVATAIFGGTAPLFCLLLTEYLGYLAPAIYVVCVAVMSFVAILTLSAKIDFNYRASSNSLPD